MKLKAEIKRRKKLERECALLAAKYASTKDWREAAQWYSSAAFHWAIRTYLENSE
jgi:hypothetical protein